MGIKMVDDEHKAVRELFSELQAILKDKNPIYMSRVGSNLGRRYAKGKEFSSVAEAMEAIANYLKNDLKLVDEASVDKDGDSVTLNIKGCKPCCGNLVKAKGGIPACPISSFPLTVLRKTLDVSKVSLEGISKDKAEDGKPIVGICHQKLTYE